RRGLAERRRGAGGARAGAQELRGATGVGPDRVGGRGGRADLDVVAVELAVELAGRRHARGRGPGAGEVRQIRRRRERDVGEAGRLVGAVLPVVEGGDQRAARAERGALPVLVGLGRGGVVTDDRQLADVGGGPGEGTGAVGGDRQDDAVVAAAGLHAGVETAEALGGRRQPGRGAAAGLVGILVEV